MVRRKSKKKVCFIGHFYIAFTLLPGLVQWNGRHLIFICWSGWKWGHPRMSDTFTNMLGMYPLAIPFLQENNTSFTGINRAKQAKDYLLVMLVWEESHRRSADKHYCFSYHSSRLGLRQSSTSFQYMATGEFKQVINWMFWVPIVALGKWKKVTYFSVAFCAE